VTQKMRNNVPRWVYKTVTTLVAIYILIGFLFIGAQVYAQPFKSASETGNIRRVPTGHDSVTVQKYYDYLNESRLLTLNETYVIDASALSWSYGFLGVILIIFFFFIFAWYARLMKHDLYPVESYNGYITERGGPVDYFNYAFYAIIISFSIYYFVVQMLYGQLY
jgi:hypothetical protein